MSLRERAREELAWWSFFLPRQGVQMLARRLPLARLREVLPRSVGERLRFGLYPARVAQAAQSAIPRSHPPWGDPAELDPGRALRYDDPPRASLLIVTYGNLALTRLCLASVQRAAGATPFELVVVDNDSPDRSADWLRGAEASGLLPMRVIANAHNAGFARANNVAAEHARGDVLVFLNNDTVVTPGWLERLVGRLDADRGVGMVGPVTNSCGNEAEIPVDYHDLDGMLGFARRWSDAHAGEQVELPMLTLFCAAMPRALFAEVGGLDDRYRVGMFEDDDLAMAVRGRGRRVEVARDAFVHHYGRAAFSRLGEATYLRIWWENRRRFEQKWGTRWEKR